MSSAEHGIRLGGLELNQECNRRGTRGRIRVLQKEASTHRPCTGVSKCLRYASICLLYKQSCSRADRFEDLTIIGPRETLLG